ncbi:MAG TPA: DUF308 domain-containing protein [Sphaerochaeta sp.]|nr:DUF308 domain-containing protein [Sphaerochaeta sp.]
MKKRSFAKNWVLTIIIGVLIALLGLFFLFQNASFLNVFIAIIGFFVLLSGVIQLFSLASYALAPFFHRATVVRSILSILFGLFAIIAPMTTLQISWKVLLYLLATILAFQALVSLINLLSILRRGVFYRSLFVDALLSLLASLLFFIFPEEIGTILMKLVGILILLAGISIIILGNWRRKDGPPSVSQQTIEGEGELLD